MDFMAFGNDELERLPDIKAGDTISCKHCLGEHVLKGSEKVLADGTKEPSDLLLFYKCGDHSYLAAIDGKLLSF